MPSDIPHRDLAGPARGRRLFSPACERNRGPILDVLRRVLPETGLVLEIGAGTGQHAAFFAAHLPGLAWQPSEPDARLRQSIEAWATDAGAANLLAPIDLDVTAADWPVRRADAVVSANLIHIAPWECCLGLMAGAGRVLEAGGVLYLYGPFRVGGRHTAPSNEAFDASLRAEDPAWGVRDLDAVAEAALARGLRIAETVPMPANNLSVVFRRTA